MAQHEHPSIIHLYLEVPMLGIEPAVEDFEHGEAALAKGESAWLLFAPIAGVALDADIHRGTWQDVQGRFSPIDESHTRVEVTGDDDAGSRVLLKPSCWWARLSFARLLKECADLARDLLELVVLPVGGDEPLQ